MRNTTAVTTTPATTKENALMVRIEESGLIPKKDTPIIVAMVNDHKASLPRIFDIIDEFGLTAYQVAVLYEVRDSFGETRPSLAALARLGQAFEELQNGDPDDIATTIIEACRRLQSRWFNTSLYHDQIIDRITAAVEDDNVMYTFDETVDLLEDEETILSADGRIIVCNQIGYGDSDDE